ncbi:hypothetical protein ACFLQL_04170 [Verrucomicrobiota bacterium]
MKYTLQARIIETTGIHDVEAKSLKEAKEKLEEAINNGDIDLEPSQQTHIEVESVCPFSHYGHRWEVGQDRTKFCKRCGHLEDGFDRDVNPLN